MAKIYISIYTIIYKSGEIDIYCFSILPKKLPAYCRTHMHAREKKVVLKFSKTKNRRVLIDKSQNVVDQANSNPNNTNLTLSRRHINFFSSKLTEGNKTHTLFLTRYRHIH